MKKGKKKMVVSIDLKYSHNIVVIAKNKPEAKKIAVEKLIKKLKLKDFNLDVDDDYFL